MPSRRGSWWQDRVDNTDIYWRSTARGKGKGASRLKDWKGKGSKVHFIKRANFLDFPPARKEQVGSFRVPVPRRALRSQICCPSQYRFNFIYFAADRNSSLLSKGVLYCLAQYLFT